MHPYIAYQILSNPANHRAPRPDECSLEVKKLLAALWQHCVRW
jgi:hypothetical protein